MVHNVGEYLVRKGSNLAPYYNENDLFSDIFHKYWHSVQQPKCKTWKIYGASWLVMTFWTLQWHDLRRPVDSL